MTTLSLRWFTHVNLGTGQISYSRRGDVDFNDGMACLTTYVNGQPKFAPVPTVSGYTADGYMTTARILGPADYEFGHAPRAAIVFFNGPDGEPVITLGIARKSTDASHGPSMWDILIGSTKAPVMALECPGEPWVALRQEVAIGRHAAALPALAAVERALAWAWLDFFDDRDRPRSNVHRL